MLTEDAHNGVACVACVERIITPPFILPVMIISSPTGAGREHVNCGASVAGKLN